VLSRRDAVQSNRDVLLDLISVPVTDWEQVTIAFSEPPPRAVAAADVDLSKAYARALEERYDLAALRALRARALSDIEVARQEARPDLTVFAGVGRGDTGAAYGDAFTFDDTVWTVGLRFEMPWLRTAEFSALREAEFRLRQVERDSEALERMILLECRLAARDLRTAVERVEATRRARDLEARKLEREQVKMAQGRSETRIVVDYQDDLEFAELAVVDAVAAYHIRLAQYRLVQGILLDSAGVAEPMRNEETRAR